jgi:hypothetical protein
MGIYSNYDFGILYLLFLFTLLATPEVLITLLDLMVISIQDVSNMKLMIYIFMQLLCLYFNVHTCSTCTNYVLLRLLFHLFDIYKLVLVVVLLANIFYYSTCVSSIYSIILLKAVWKVFKNICLQLDHGD